MLTGPPDSDIPPIHLQAPPKDQKNNWNLTLTACGLISVAALITTTAYALETSISQVALPLILGIGALAFFTHKYNLIDISSYVSFLQHPLRNQLPPHTQKLSSPSYSNFTLAPSALIRFYANKTPLRALDEAGTCSLHRSIGGACAIGAQLMRKFPDAVIGMMIAANSGRPGGGLAKHLEAGVPIDERGLLWKTQEEAILANAFLTTCGKDYEKQLDLYKKTLCDKWGMSNKDPRATDYATFQGIDFVKTTNIQDFNESHIVHGYKVSSPHIQDSRISGIDPSTTYPIVTVFADGPNTSRRSFLSSSMTRTCNERAQKDYTFFYACIKEKLRSALDGMARAGVTHPFIALLSTNCYAGPWIARICDDYPRLLHEVLVEVVGPKGEQRGQYFQKIIVPDIVQDAGQGVNWAKYKSFASSTD